MMWDLCRCGIIVHAGMDCRTSTPLAVQQSTSYYINPPCGRRVSFCHLMPVCDHVICYVTTDEEIEMDYCATPLALGAALCRAAARSHGTMALTFVGSASHLNHETIPFGHNRGLQSISASPTSEACLGAGSASLRSGGHTAGSYRGWAR